MEVVILEINFWMRRKVEMVVYFACEKQREYDADLGSDENLKNFQKSVNYSP